MIGFFDSIMLRRKLFVVEFVVEPLVSRCNQHFTLLFLELAPKLSLFCCYLAALDVAPHFFGSPEHRQFVHEYRLFRNSG